MVFLAPAGLPSIAVAGIVLALLSSASVSILTWTLFADTVEYGAWITGVRVQGINYALLAAARKLGMGFGVGLVAFSLAWGGYASAVPVQADSAILAIRAAAGLLPAVLILAAAGIMYWYRLTDEKRAELVAACTPGGRPASSSHPLFYAARPAASLSRRYVKYPVCVPASPAVMVLGMTNRWYAYFSLALEGPASN